MVRNEIRSYLYLYRGEVIHHKINHPCVTHDTKTCGSLHGPNVDVNTHKK